MPLSTIIYLTRTVYVYVYFCYSPQSNINPILYTWLPICFVSLAQSTSIIPRCHLYTGCLTNLFICQQSLPHPPTPTPGQPSRHHPLYIQPVPQPLCSNQRFGISLLLSKKNHTYTCMYNTILYLSDK